MGRKGKNRENYQNQGKSELYIVSIDTLSTSVINHACNNLYHTN